MSHEIKQYDIQEGREIAWHKLTKLNPQLSLENCHLNQRDVFISPVFDAVGNPIFPLDVPENEYTLNRAYSVLRMTDTGLPIGNPFNPYTFRPPTNEKFLKIIGQAIKDVQCILESCGTILNRSRVFLSFKVKDIERFKVGKREFAPFLAFGHGFDKGESIFCNLTTTCIVCNNTFTLVKNTKGTGLDVRIKQTKNTDIRLENLPQIVDQAIGLVGEFKAEFERLMEKRVKEEQARDWFAGFVLPGEKVTPLSTRSSNIVNRLTSLFNGQGKGNEGQNRADIFSAVTDYYTHESAGDDTWKQFVSSEFGAGSNRKQEAFELIKNDEKFINTVKRGHATFELTDRVNKLVAQATN